MGGVLPWTGSGTNLATRSASANGMAMARAMSRTPDARLDLVHGDDLADVVLAVLLGDVADDLVAPVHAEVDVEVRHADALGVEEALEQQLVVDGIDVGDAQAVRHERAGARAAARADGDAVLLGVADEVPDDEEVAREVHLLDDAQLEREARRVDVLVDLVAAAVGLGEARLQALLGDGRAGSSRRSCPSGTWNFGRNVLPSLNSTLHSSPMRAAFSMASGMCAK